MEKKIITFLLAFLLITPVMFCQEADPGNLEKIVSELASDSYRGRGFGTEEGKRAAQFIIEQFRANGVVPFLDSYRQQFHHRSGTLNITGNNIIGLIPGGDPDLAREYIILGAHYDHVGWKAENGDTIAFNGADDNASGVAAVIELGRILMQGNERPGRSVILVAFDGEETGLIGSNAFVDALISGPGARIDSGSVVAMFSLDMVGMYSAHSGIDLQGIELLKDHAQLVAAAKTKSPVEITKSTGDIPARTDTAPFGKKGIPSVHVFTGMESPYHKPEDDSDLLDYEGMATIVNFMATLTGEIAGVEEVNKVRMMETIAEKDGIRHLNPGITLNTGGSHHDYNSEFFKAKGVFAYSAGLVMETRITQWLAVQPEVIYEWSGSKIQDGKLHTHAVTVPFSILLTSPDQGMGVRNYYQVGGYYSYAFGGKAGGTPMDLVNDYRNTDYGFIFGVGFQIMKFRIGYLFQGSLVDFTLSDNPAQDVRLKGSFAKISWMF